MKEDKNRCEFVIARSRATKQSSGTPDCFRPHSLGSSPRECAGVAMTVATFVHLLGPLWIFVLKSFILRKVAAHLPRPSRRSAQ